MSIGPGCQIVADRAQTGTDRVTVTIHRPAPDTGDREIVGVGFCVVREGVGPLEAERRARKEAMIGAANHDRR
jgi:hypothetical protein